MSLPKPEPKPEPSQPWPPITGWQQPPTPTQKPTCPHLGLIFAVLTIHRHAEGHKWVCGCGQVFMVVSDAGRNKQLVEYKERKQ